MGAYETPRLFPRRVLASPASLASSTGHAGARAGRRGGRRLRRAGRRRRRAAPSAWASTGKPVLENGYGMADLEHDVANTPDTIFEAGSVSKQFTAAAVLLLARDGKLSLDDPVRKYIPELPDYGAPLTIRHMLTTPAACATGAASRASPAGRATTRVHTHAHVLDIVSAPAAR